MSRAIIQRISGTTSDCASSGSAPAVWLHTTISGPAVGTCERSTPRRLTPCITAAYSWTSR